MSTIYIITYMNIVSSNNFSCINRSSYNGGKPGVSYSEAGFTTKAALSQTLQHHSSQTVQALWRHQPFPTWCHHKCSI